MTRPSLPELAIRHGTDKEGLHFYAAAYERHLEHLRDEPIRLLEIGVGGYSDPGKGGESLRMWKEYFAQGQIVGVDIHDKSALEEDRIAILRGDQSDPAFLAQVGSQFGPFDVIVDDGSHVSAHVIASFRGLFPYLTDDGIYAVEDLQTSYWPRYGGSSGPDRSATSMTFLESLVDGLNFAELDLVGYEPTVFDQSIVAVTFYHNLAFIQKGDNRAASTILPAHPRDALLMGPKPAAQRPRRGLATRVPRPVRSVAGGVRRRLRGSRPGRP